MQVLIIAVLVAVAVAAPPPYPKPSYPAPSYPAKSYDYVRLQYKPVHEKVGFSNNILILRYWLSLLSHTLSNME